MPAFGPVGTKVGALCAKMGGTAEAIFTAFVPFYTGQRLFFSLMGDLAYVAVLFFLPVLAVPASIFSAPGEQLYSLPI